MTSDFSPERLRGAMNERGMPQAEVARRLGVSDQAVHGWLQGKPPGRKNLIALADLFGKAVEHFSARSPIEEASPSMESAEAQDEFRAEVEAVRRGDIAEILVRLTRAMEHRSAEGEFRARADFAVQRNMDALIARLPGAANAERARVSASPVGSETTESGQPSLRRLPDRD